MLILYIHNLCVMGPHSQALLSRGPKACHRILMYIILYNIDILMIGLNKLNLNLNLKSWTTANKLKFNDSKTEIIHFTSKYRTSHPLPPIKVGDTVVNAISKSRNLGVIFDSPPGTEGSC